MKEFIVRVSDCSENPPRCSFAEIVAESTTSPPLLRRHAQKHHDETGADGTRMIRSPDRTTGIIQIRTTIKRMV